jgi:hypothetical protein
MPGVGQDKFVKPKLDLDLGAPPHRENTAGTNKENSDGALVAARPVSEPVIGQRQKFTLDIAKTLEVPREPTEKQLRQEKLARYDKECTKVLDWLYVGGLKVAENRELLVGMGISHVVNACAPTTPNLFPESFTYRAVFINDAPSEEIVAHLYPVLAFMEEARAGGRKVLVHCTQGVSRSCSMCIAYLMLHQRMEYDEAFNFVKARRGVCNPNPGFCSKLVRWGRRVLEHAAHAPGAAPAARSPRIFCVDYYYQGDARAGAAPLPVASGTALSPHAVYVVEGGDCVFVWAGRAAAADKAEAARSHVAAMQRFEGAPAKVAAERDGRESEDLAALLKMLGCSLPAQGGGPAFPQGGAECVVATPRAPLPVPPVKLGMPSTGLVGDAPQEEGEGGEEESAGGEARRCRLFEIPGFDELDNFDSDDLWPSKAFLLVPGAGGAGGAREAQVWIGEEFSEVSVDDPAACEAWAEAAGRECAAAVGVELASLAVVLEGAEPDEFWEFFELG